MSTSPFYSAIPRAERHEWSDEDLSVAIWDEAVHLAGGDSFGAADIAKLPFGFRAVLAEGCVRAHVEGDGLACTIWNDDGVAIFKIARDCHAAFGSSNLVHLLDEVIALVLAWQSTGPRSPRSLDAPVFIASDLGLALETRTERLDELADPAFHAMMTHLRAHPKLFDA